MIRTKLTQLYLIMSINEIGSPLPFFFSFPFSPFSFSRCQCHRLYWDRIFFLDFAIISSSLPYSLYPSSPSDSIPSHPTFYFMRKFSWILQMTIWNRRVSSFNKSIQFLLCKISIFPQFLHIHIHIYVYIIMPQSYRSSITKW